MTSSKTLVMERPTAVRHSVASGVKTILLHIQNDNSLGQGLETALSLARACGAHLSCLHVTAIEAYVAFDSFGGVFAMNDVIEALDKEEAELRSSVEEKLRNEDISWDYTQVTGNIAGQIVSHAALADLVIVGREAYGADLTKTDMGLLGDLIHRARTPLLVAANDGQLCDPNGRAMIAWNGSYEVANAIRSSTGLLKLASTVHVVQIAEDDKDETFPSTRLLEYLSRHDIHAELSTIEAGVGLQDSYVIADMLMARARELDAEYLVMGGYSHNRVSEYIFGGVTRTLLTNKTGPLLIAH